MARPTAEPAPPCSLVAHRAGDVAHRQRLPTTTHRSPRSTTRRNGAAVSCRRARVATTEGTSDDPPIFKEWGAVGNTHQLASIGDDSARRFSFGGVVMPAPKKPADRRQRGRSRSDMRTNAVAVPDVAPRAPEGLAAWSDATSGAWVELWSSPLAVHYKQSDVAALCRLFTYRQRLDDALARAVAEPESKGSTGQMVISPWHAEIHRLEAAIGKLEDRFGLTPLARIRLGVSLEEGVSLAAKNAELLRSFHDAQD